MQKSEPARLAERKSMAKIQLRINTRMNNGHIRTYYMHFVKQLERPFYAKKTPTIIAMTSARRMALIAIRMAKNI